MRLIMWWLFSLYDFAWPVWALKELVATINFERVTTQFILLGIIPGTKHQINFADIVYMVWFVAFVALTVELFLKAQRIINRMDPYRHFSPQNYINLISL